MHITTYILTMHRNNVKYDCPPLQTLYMAIVLYTPSLALNVGKFMALHMKGNHSNSIMVTVWGLISLNKHFFPVIWGLKTATHAAHVHVYYYKWSIKPLELRKQNIYYVVIVNTYGHMWYHDLYCQVDYYVITRVKLLFKDLFISGKHKK